MKKKGIILFILLILIPLFSSGAEKKDKFKLSSDKPINITSDRLELNNKDKTITFIGNVIAKQEDMTIYSDKIVATYSDNRRDIKKVVATGDVKITKGDRVATCRRAVFDNIKKTVVLTEEPKIWQGKDFISGDKITFLIDEDRVLVEGSVRGIIAPKKEIKE
jgi:lipopolysaccharide export system protein LptA